jgi:opacity protein-like surface antigen
MKKAVLAVLACFGIGVAMNAVALEDYVGVTLDAVRSSENGVNDTSAGFTGMISARPNRYYGYEVQGGVFGRIGPHSANGEADFALAGFLPLAGSGINLYGKAGVDTVYSSGNVFNTGLTYGAGVEYQRGKGVLRLGYQHFNAGQSPSFGARLVGITFLVKLDK